MIFSYFVTHPGTIWTHLLQHVWLVAVSLAIACAIALPLGIMVARTRVTGGIILQSLNVAYTIPSLAIFGVLVPLLGIGSATAIVALVIYAQMLLVRNLAAGLRGVPPAQIEAARGLGLTATQRFWRVEVPHALPVVLAGMRVATITLISLATLGAWVDAGGLGVLILYGLEHDRPDQTIAGSLVAAALAVAADRGFRYLEARATKW